MRSPAKAFLILAGLAVAACNDTMAPDEADLFNADVAVVAADGAMDGVRLMSDPNMHRGGPFDRTRTVTFYDAAGAVQAAYDSLTTASMKIKVDVTGEAEREKWSASVERHSEMTVSGLLGKETTRTFNGSGTEKVLRSRHSDEFGTRTYEITGEFAYNNVVAPVPGSATPWPLSGTITRHMVVKITNGRNGDETKERTVIITFNGTQFPTISVNGEVSELDLATRPGKFFGPLFLKMRMRNGRGG
jgi:hypothetical protein